MKRICLIACASSKKNVAQPAKDLYISSLFQKSVEWMKKQDFDEWFILSAQHELLQPNKVIAPYNQTLNNMSAKQRKIWAENVFQALKPHLDENTSVTFMAGKKYREHLENSLRKIGCQIIVPMEGLRIGKQLQWLSNNT